MQTEKKDWKYLLSFLIFLTSPVILVIVMLGIPLFVGSFDEQLASTAMIIGFILFALAMLFALSHLDLD